MAPSMAPTVPKGPHPRSPYTSPRPESTGTRGTIACLCLPVPAIACLCRSGFSRDRKSKGAKNTEMPFFPPRPPAAPQNPDQR